MAEAVRLTNVSAGRIRRWLRGYQFRTLKGPKESPPVWQHQLTEIDGKIVLSFLDLIEVRFINAFLNTGVSWKTLRDAADKARTLTHSDHPFCTRKFVTDGRKIFAELYDQQGDISLLELKKSQRYFNHVISPYLKNLEFDEDMPARWWPLGKIRQVIIDPTRCFGQPIVDTVSIPTSVLAQAVKVNGSPKEVARWYEIDVTSVKNAVLFEQKLHERSIAA